MKKISLIAASLLLAGNVAANDSLESAIKAGTFSGDVTLYGETQNNSGDNKDSGFTMGSINIAYETGEFNGFKASVGARANHDFSEKNDGEDYNNDAENGKEDKSILHTLNVSYANDFGSLTVGRQEIDLEWMGDFHEAAVLAVTAIPNITLVAGYSERVGVADADAAIEKFDDLGNGAFVLDAKFEGISNVVLNPYYYNVDKDTDAGATADASWYGLKADFDTDMFGLTVHGAKSSEDETNKEDGQIIHTEARLNVAGFGFGAGYVATDKDGGIGSMDAAGDNINPFDAIAGGDGNQVYGTDAKTTYASVNYEIAGVGLTAVYGETKYDTDTNENEKEKELDLAVEYGITDNLTVAGLYIGVDAEDSNEDYDKFTLTLEYTF